jgi:hypothetical protein
MPWYLFVPKSPNITVERKKNAGGLTAAAPGDD